MGADRQAGGRWTTHGSVLEPGRHATAHWRENPPALAPGVTLPGGQST